MTIQIDIGAVSCIVGVLYLSCFLIIVTVTDTAFFATSKYLEHIAAIEVNGGRAPYLGVHTLTATKHIERLTQYVHTLLGKDDAAVSLSDVILVVAVELVFTFIILSHFVEEYLAVNDRAIDIDDYVTVDDTAGIASTIDVTAIETTVFVFIGTGGGWT